MYPLQQRRLLLRQLIHQATQVMYMYWEIMLMWLITEAACVFSALNYPANQIIATQLATVLCRQSVAMLFRKPEKPAMNILTTELLVFLNITALARIVITVARKAMFPVLIAETEQPPLFLKFATTATQ